jgi:glucoside 3-dehydrogenase (cytochrome c) hitch-hiker subunit
MNRRHALMGLSAIAGHALFPDVLAAFAASLASGAQDGWPVQVVNDSQSRILTEAVDTILPQTSTPGAKAARVHVFVDLALAKCASPADQKKMLAALDALGPAFVTAAPAARQKALEAMDKDAFAMLKELTVLGYFSSEIGATQALAYDKVPGGYWGCLDLKPGQKGWATR